ncbi:hypothetical protein AB0395_47565 [Streptosporangium sp. NPDC051023]|uniref:hypothetical protein n=1 Tax=Streptosporangium sp. NPDC051023 TaxID=3155410 RepID=UPI00344C6B8C
MGYASDLSGEIQAHSIYAPEGHVYVIKFSSGRVKVGFTADLKTRLANHVGAAKAHGITIEEKWTSPFHKEARPNEKRLIEFCRSIPGAEASGEHFTGVSFDDIVKFATSELVITRATAAASQRERDKAAKREERARLLDLHEAATQPGRDRMKAALEAVGLKLAPLATWLNDPAAAAMLERLYNGEQVPREEIEEALGKAVQRATGGAQ